MKLFAYRAKETMTLNTVHNILRGLEEEETAKKRKKNNRMAANRDVDIITQEEIDRRRSGVEAPMTQ